MADRYKRSHQKIEQIRFLEYKNILQITPGLETTNYTLYLSVFFSLYEYLTDRPALERHQ